MGLVEILMSVGQSDCSLDPPGVRGTSEKKSSMGSGGNTQVSHLWRSFKLSDATHVQFSGGRPRK